ncbi:oxidoreductase-like protein [Rubrobacter xylanophilus DSM 9941]|uniref:Oxidoreductase-like protein n=1 Tax=Rubrobacter xylanophilus (strain DSM 9941 / JCM 11954 / NBRC 16129 / PRD-1) TaxID=266117 RepID=Q1AV89_RUBXD|nr:Gfo/Idh/MocA family oxidoreductase [Rubrobacter xylanophilus]ABG04689.1 oxidoreductase-like protein [Rubrobacter xylanophilus DSM 9941]
MRREIGVAVIGMGWMGQVHSRGYRRLFHHYPECPLRPRLVVAADAVGERARQSAELLGFEGWTADWREAVEHPEVEAVSIATPNYLHREIAVAAARAGKHIWLEKPCGRVPEETYEIARAVEEAGVRSTVGLMYRHVPVVEHARELIASGALGEITHYRGYFLADYAADPHGALTWRYKLDGAGLGVLGDIMPHTVDMAQNLLGPIESVLAQKETFIKERPEVPEGMGTGHFVVEGGEMGAVENEDYVGCLVRFASGARGTLENSRVCVGPHVRNAFEVNGTEGALAWDFQRLNELELYRFDGTGERGYKTVYAAPKMGDFERFQPGAGISMGYDDLKVTEAYRFLTSIYEGRQKEPGMAEIVSAMRVVEAMDRSCRSGGWEAVGQGVPSERGAGA